MIMEMAILIMAGVLLRAWLGLDVVDTFIALYGFCMQ